MNDIYYRNEFIKSMRNVSSSIDEYVELSDYQMIFEADNPDVKNTVQQNAQVEQKGTNALTRAMNAIINMIKNLIKTIKDFFTSFTMKKADKNAFYAFREACKKDPSLANKQVHISDWKKAIDTREAQYNSLCSKLDASIRKMDVVDGVVADKILQDARTEAEKFIKGTSSALAKDTVVITAGILEKWGQSNIDHAKHVLTILENDEKFYQSLVDSMGEKGAEKYKKRMKQYSSKNVLMDFKIKASRTMYNNIIECAKAEAREITRFGGIGLIGSHVGREVLKNQIKTDFGQEVIAQSIKGRKENKFNKEYENHIANEPKSEEYHTDADFRKAHAEWEEKRQRIIAAKSKFDHKQRR